ncbi:MAG: amino acid ABC transporter permease [Actinomycetota bacterium]
MAEMMTSPELELAPELPPHGPVVWLKNNLFQTAMSGVMSVLAILLVIFAVKGLLGWAFDATRRWDAVTFNMKLMMVLAYPGDQMWRVWISVGIVIVLLAATFAVWRIGGKAEPRNVGRTAMAVGGAFIFASLLSPWSATGKLLWVVGGAVLLLVGWALRTRMGERTKEPLIPVLGIVVALFGIVVIVMWTITVPWPEKVDGSQVIVHEAIAMSTRIPWTILYFLAIAVYLVTKLFMGDRDSGRAQSWMIGLWVFSFPFIVLVLLRAPQVDMGRAVSFYLPLFAVSAAAGWFILAFVGKHAKSDMSRVIGAALLLLAAVSFLFPMEFVFRFLLLGIALFALLAPTFGGEGAGQRSLQYTWLVTALIIVLATWLTLNESGIDTPRDSFLGGLMLTLVLAITSIVLSFPIGVLMALGRTSTMPIFRLLSTMYIELVRGVPLITWLLVAFIMLPVAVPENIQLTGVMKALGAMTFFSAAYLAENVRGGLQSIPKGQNEAAKALGMSTLQMTVFITLPQALRAVIPALVGQVIALFKDTSLVTIVGLFDFLHIARSIIPAQSNPFLFKGSITVTLIFAAMVYWMFTFTFSRISLRIEKKLGVGER